MAMKILMFAPIFPPQIGGPATQCASLCRALQERGEYPIVLTPGDSFSYSVSLGYPVYRYRWGYTGMSVDKFIRWVLFTIIFLYIVVKERPHVLHVHSVSTSSFVAGAIAKIIRLPSIIKFAGDWVWETLSTSGVKGKDFNEVYASSFKGKVLRRIEQWGVGFFTVIWTPSQFRAQNVQELLGSTQKIRHIPNSLILPDRALYPDKQETITIISANRFIPHKRISYIVRAFALAHIPQARLVLIGGGQDGERTEVESEIERLQLSDRVILTGILSSSAIYEQFAAASVYVSASLEEGFPNVFIEAMHFGLPIVSTDVGGCRELVEEGVTGFLVPTDAIEAMAERIRQLAINQELRTRMGIAAEKASVPYDLRIVVDRFIELYRELSHTSS